MADIALTASQVSLVDPGQCETYDFETAETVTAGQAVYLTAAGKIGVADANAAGKQQTIGVVVKITGKAATVLKRGRAYGFTTSAQAFGSTLFLSDTAGALADAAGTLSVPVGKVMAIAESGSPKKCVYIDANWRETLA